MKRKIKGKKNVASIISLIVIFFLIAGAIGGITYLSKNNGGINTVFSVSYNGDTIDESAYIGVFDSGKKYVFDLHYPLFENKSYSVKLEANEDFNYFVDSELFGFATLGDITQGFIIEKGDKSFTISYDSVTSILKAFHEGAEIIALDDKYIGEDYEVILTVSSGDVVIKSIFKIHIDGVKSVSVADSITF